MQPWWAWKRERERKSDWSTDDTNVISCNLTLWSFFLSFSFGQLVIFLFQFIIIIILEPLQYVIICVLNALLVKLLQKSKVTNHFI